VQFVRLSDNSWSYTLPLACKNNSITSTITCNPGVTLTDFNSATCADKWSVSVTSTCGTFAVEGNDGVCTNDSPPFWPFTVASLVGCPDETSCCGGCEASDCKLADGDEYAFSGEQALCTAWCERFSACYALNWPDNDPNAYHDDNFGNTVSNLNGGGFADTFNIEDVTSEQFSSRLNARNGCLLCEHAFWALEPAETCSESEEYNRGFRWGVSVIGADGTAKWITSEIFDGAASLVGNYLQVFPDLGEVGFDCPGVPSLDCPP